MASVQIPEELLAQMYYYMHFGNGSHDVSDDAQRLRTALNAKLDAMKRRKTYTAYKTARDEQERVRARQEYLDNAGIPEQYRW